MKYAFDRKYPIETEDQLVKAAEYFDKHLTRFRPEDRIKIAGQLDKRSCELGVNLNKDWIINYTRLEKSASLSPDFKSAMKMRKEACIRRSVKIIAGNDEIKAEAFVDGIIKCANKMSPKELMLSVFDFDKKAGIEYLYDNEILDPVITVFGSLNNPEFDAIKVAGDATQYDLIRASRDREKLAKLQNKLGEDFTSGFKSNPIKSIEKMGRIEKEVLSYITKK
jgi:hypothetical protein